MTPNTFVRRDFCRFRNYIYNATVSMNFFTGRKPDVSALGVPSLVVPCWNLILLGRCWFASNSFVEEITSLEASQEFHDEEIPHHEILEMPQGMHFPPQNYWEQIDTSLGELSSNMGQLRVEHQEHSIIPHEIREDQRAMREEQQRQGRDIEELKDIIGSSRRKCHHH